MNLFKAIFSAPEVVSEAAKAVINTGDALVFTPEEKSVANQKMLDWLLEFHKASSGSRIAQRLIALMTTGVFMVLILATAGLAPFAPEKSAAVLRVVSETGMPWLVGAVFTFYYGKNGLPWTKK